MIDLTTEPGGLFPRLGRTGRVLRLLDECQADLAGTFVEIGDQYEDTLRDLVGPVNQAADAQVRSILSPMAQLAGLAQSTLVRMVVADQPTVPRTVAACIQEVIRQMRLVGATVPACTVTAVATPFASNTGNGVLVVSTVRGDGLVHENLAAETAKVLCTADSYNSTATAGQEPFLYVGADPQTAGVLDYDYPPGTGARTPLAQASPSVNTSLVNGDFATWASNAASYWTAATGSWNTNFLQDATAFAGSYSVRFAAGATLSAFYQQFNDSTSGTGSVLIPWVSYAVNLWCRVKAGAASAGVLTVKLVDANGDTIADEQGTPNEFSFSIAALTTTWVARNGTFRLPKVPPSTIRLKLAITTALAGADVLVDDIAMTPMTPAYPGGLSMAAFPGSTPWAIDDGWDVQSTNDRAGQPYLSTWQAYWDRLFGMRQLGFVLPSSGSPTIPDSLLTDSGAPSLDFSQAKNSQFAVAPSPMRI